MHDYCLDQLMITGQKMIHFIAFEASITVSCLGTQWYEYPHKDEPA